MIRRKPVQVYLDEDDRGRLERLADRLGLSMAETLRVALRRLAAEEWGGDDPLLRRAGTLESPDVPADLSTRHDEYAVSGYPSPQIAERRPPGPDPDE
jgi:hypothetical protein